MESKFYFEDYPEDTYTAEEVAGMMVSDGFLIDEQLNENFTAADIFLRMNDSRYTENVQEDLEDTFRDILTKRIETDKDFRKEHEIECEGE